MKKLKDKDDYNITLPKKLEIRAQKVASANNCDLETLLLNAIDEHVQDLEEVIEALKIMNDPHRTTYTSEEADIILSKNHV